MIDISKSYDNKALLEALKDRDETYKSIIDTDNYMFECSDEDLELFERIKHLSQFQKDLLYLTSKMSVNEVAKLYYVSTRYIYLKLAETKNTLREK